MKTAFLYNFTKFVEWPDTTNANTRFIIGIVGEDPFGKGLDDAVKSETVRGRPIVIQRLKSGDKLPACDILFISRSERDNFETILNSVEEFPVLTVADLPGAAAKGAMVNLLVVQGSVKMEINRHEAERAHLQISSKLLGLAKIVESDK